MDKSLADRDSLSTSASPQVGAWTKLLSDNHESFPDFALRPGDSYLVAMKTLYARVGQGLGVMPPRHIAHG